MRNTLVVATFVATAALAMGFQSTSRPPVVSGQAASAQPSATASVAPATEQGPQGPLPIRARAPLTLTEDERMQGFGECNMPDPGDGFYAPARTVALGTRVFIPQKGAHTDDMGFDVVMHFHGLAAVKKGVVVRGQGVVLAGLDLGEGTSVYNNAFRFGPAFAQVRGGITQALRAHTGDERAHIRHLALSAWSAGYAAINAILAQQGPEGVDAVVLLDGFHAGYLPEATGSSLDGIDAVPLSPLFDFAASALDGSKLFYFSHSRIEPPGYASTSKMAARLLRSLDLRPRAAIPTDDPLGLESYVDEKGLHIRAFGGTDERAHCDHTRNLGEVVSALLEPTWSTPPALRE